MHKRAKVFLPCAVLVMLVTAFLPYPKETLNAYFTSLLGPFTLFTMEGEDFFMTMFCIWFSCTLIILHPVHPRWWTGLLTIIGFFSWWVFGGIIYLDGLD